MSGPNGLLGDTASSAVVSAGAIAWWCPHRFDAAPVFTRLIDPAGGALVVSSPGSTDLGYLPGTNVVRTVMAAPGGSLEVLDLLPWAGPGHTPPGQLVRILTALAGTVDVQISVEPARDGWSGGVAGDGFVVHTGVPMHATGGDQPLWTGERTMEAGDRLVVSTDEPLAADGALRVVEETARSWHSYLAPVTYDGDYRRAVERSLLVIRALTSSDLGGIVTSPIHPQCRAVDAATARRVLHEVGLAGDADDLHEWLLGLLRGEESLTEEEAGELLLAVDPERAPAQARRLTDWLAEHGTGVKAAIALEHMAKEAQRANPLDLDAARWRLEARTLRERTATPEPDAEEPPPPSVAELAKAARWDEAHERMEAMVGQMGPLGLGELTAAEHLAVVDGALALARGPR